MCPVVISISGWAARKARRRRGCGLTIRLATGAGTGWEKPMVAALPTWKSPPTLGLQREAAVAPHVTEQRCHPDPGLDEKANGLEVELSKTSEVWNDLDGLPGMPPGSAVPIVAILLGSRSLWSHWPSG